MLEKIERKLRNRMEKWTKKKLVTCGDCLVLFAVLLLLSLGFLFEFTDNFAISIIGIILYVAIIFILVCLFYIIDSILVDMKETDEFAGLANMLSRKIPKEVRYSPFSIDEKYNAELEECIKLLSADNVTHYAILKDSYVLIISRNNRGKNIGERKVDATTFCRNYELLELLNLSNDG